MKIELIEITVRDLADGYQDNAEGGVVGYGGKNYIRPPYQRGFISKDKQQNAVFYNPGKNISLKEKYLWVRGDGGF